MNKFLACVLVAWMPLTHVWSQSLKPVLPDASVYYALDSKVIGEGKRPEAAIVRRMVDSLVMELTNQPTVADAWRSLVSPADVVGIKVSTSAGILGGTREAVASAIASGLRSAGLPRSQVLVWDRNLEDLLACGFRKDSPDYTLRWVDPATGYDPKSQVSAPVLGKLIWGDSRFGISKTARYADLLASGDQLSNQSFYSKILAREVTKIINVPSATDSFLTGINGALAGITLANLDNWRRFTKAPEHGDPYIAEIYNDEIIRKKVVLTMLDALIVQYAGGPYGNPNFTVDNGAIFASRDPVALDATLVEMVDEVRKASKLPSVKPMSAYIDSATQLGLGQSMPSRIRTVRVGVRGLQ
ncbi:MAG: DUF362 domain-containing protein [Terrimicrobiaceae bacterium]